MSELLSIPHELTTLILAMLDIPSVYSAGLSCKGLLKLQRDANIYHSNNKLVNDCVRYDYVSLLGALIEMGLPVCYGDIQECAKCGSTQMMDVISRIIDKFDQERKTCLYIYAAGQPNVDMLEWLHNRGIKCDCGLMTAIIIFNTVTVKWFLDHTLPDKERILSIDNQYIANCALVHGMLDVQGKRAQIVDMVRKKIAELNAEK